MSEGEPKTISAAQRRARLHRATRAARSFGFEGKVEYRHVSTTSGGAQFRPGPSAAEDMLIVFAKAFERDADPAEFSLEAIIAHERGHQLILRHYHLSGMLVKWRGLTSEEILASVVGSVIVGTPVDKEALMFKAVAEAMDRGLEMTHAVRLLKNLQQYLEQLL